MITHLLSTIREYKGQLAALERRVETANAKTVEAAKTAVIIAREEQAGGWEFKGANGLGPGTGYGFRPDTTASGQIPVVSTTLRSLANSSMATGPEP